MRALALALVACVLASHAARAQPTAAPDAQPTTEPAAQPTAAPDVQPTAAPAAPPTAAPDAQPAAAPAAQPSAAPGAQPSLDVTTVLRDANASASAGDWHHVAELVSPLLHRPLIRADLAEAHRLMGLAAFFASNGRADAEAHLLAYLELEPDARLDPSLVPPEAVTFFEDVRVRHAAELRAHRPRKRVLALALLPAINQLYYGERVKGWILGGALTALLATNLTTDFVLRAWCSQTDDTCDGSANKMRHARELRTVNLVSGIGLIATYLYGVIDGVVGYRTASHEELLPYVSGVDGRVVLGVALRF
jgi:hypothetical protein